MKSFRHFILAICAIIPAACWALVNPESTTMPIPQWSAEIFVVGSDGTYAPYCKGSLIARQWVLSSSSCYYDPFKAKDTALDRTNPDFVIRLGNSEVYLAVADQIESDDYVMTLWRLAQPVTNAPLKLSTQTAATLLNANVVIFGTQSTPAVKHSFFNPAQGANLTCTMDGVTFFTTDTICYLLGPATSSTTVLATAGIVIDPRGPNAPATPLDRAVRIDESGARLYLDFRTSNSYPCNEDLGAPVLWRNDSGELEQVGVVSVAGMAGALPICTQSLANDIRSVAHYQPFITRTLVDYEFARLCPEAPQPVVTYTGVNGLDISWPAVPGATGYRIHYTSDIGILPITALDLKNQTQVSTTNLNTDFVYTATVAAYNETCTGPQSEILTIRF